MKLGTRVVNEGTQINYMNGILDQYNTEKQITLKGIPSMWETVITVKHENFKIDDEEKGC